jgi:hypothetical protein
MLWPPYAGSLHARSGLDEIECMPVFQLCACMLSQYGTELPLRQAWKHLPRTMRSYARSGSHSFSPRDILPVPVVVITVGKGNSQAAEDMAGTYHCKC